MTWQRITCEERDRLQADHPEARVLASATRSDYRDDGHGGHSVRGPSHDVYAAWGDWDTDVYIWSDWVGPEGVPCEHRRFVPDDGGAE